MKLRIYIVIFSIVLLGYNCIFKNEPPKLHIIKEERFVYYEQENIRLYLDTIELNKVKEFISSGAINLRILHDSLHYQNCKEIVTMLKTKVKDKEIINDLYYKGYEGNSIQLKKIEQLEDVKGKITLVLVFDNPCYIDGNYSIVKIKLERDSDKKISLISMSYEGNWL